MKLIETKTLGSSQSAIEFTSIPQDGTDLIVMFAGRGAAGGNADGLTIRFNSTSTGYSSRRLYVFNSSVATDTNAAQFVVNSSGSTSNSFSTVGIHIPNYTSNNFKLFSIEGGAETNASNSFVGFGSVLWSNTAPITSILLQTESTSNLLAGSTASLYKITNGSDRIVTTSP